MSNKDKQIQCDFAKISLEIQDRGRKILNLLRDAPVLQEQIYEKFMDAVECLNSPSDMITKNDLEMASFHLHEIIREISEAPEPPYNKVMIQASLANLRKTFEQLEGKCTPLVCCIPKTDENKPEYV